MTHHYHVMHTVFGGLKLAGCWFAGMGAGILAETLPVIKPETHVPLGTAVGVGVSCLLAAMWLSRRLTKLQDGQEVGKQSNEALTRAFADLKEEFKKLPCHEWQRKPCPECEKQRKKQ